MCYNIMKVGGCNQRLLDQTEKQRKQKYCPFGIKKNKDDDCKEIGTCMNRKKDCLGDSLGEECNQFICVLSSSFRTPSNSGDRYVQERGGGGGGGGMGFDLMDSDRLLRHSRKEESDSCDRGFDFNKSFKFKKSRRRKC